ncbi:AlbA family DNA-binding domain-containing protein [Rhizobium mongolense]|uniref:Schlafen AlbA-2 domain-containing protein n=1 Tax=Rhizobium mongolense TaxID=57676 RepID=A0A7W6RVF3_9HYPH|nr:ATP-binding protein [Rhizobium mongolense]MBB4279354.1 hypothetical protein [Rhizobium mongolense]
MASILEIARKVVSEISIDDFETLIALQAPESDILELKSDLPTPDKASGWRSSRSLHPKESRSLAKEIVAFANTSGGRIYVGIGETSDHPKRASSLGEPLPDLANLVERLRDAFSAVIAPSVPQLQVVGVTTNATSNEGYIVVDVPKTLLAPHGLRNPLECYWRRDSTCKPMEMADLHNAFWEARTGRERISEELNLGRRKFSNYAQEQEGLSYRFTAVSEVALDMPKLAKDLREGRIAPHSMSGPAAGVADFPLWSLHEWKFRAFGTERFKENSRRSTGNTRDRWRIEQTGIIELLGSITSGQDADGSVIVDAYDFCATAAHLIHLADYISQYTSQRAGRWILEGEFRSKNDKDFLTLPDNPHRHEKFDLSRGARFLPIAIDLEDSTAETFRTIEDRIFETFGIECPDAARQPYSPPRGLL